MKKQIDSLTSYLCGRNNSCGSKIDYRCMESAQRGALRMTEKKQGTKTFEAYHCWYCQGFHIGGSLNLTPYKFLRILYFWIKKPLIKKLSLLYNK